MSSSFVCVERLWLSFKYSCNAAEKNKKSLGNNNQKWPFLHSINPELQSAVLMLKKEAQTRGKNLLFHAGNFFRVAVHEASKWQGRMDGRLFSDEIKTVKFPFYKEITNIRLNVSAIGKNSIF